MPLLFVHLRRAQPLGTRSFQLSCLVRVAGGKNFRAIGEKILDLGAERTRGNTSARVNDSCRSWEPGRMGMNVDRFAQQVHATVGRAEWSGCKPQVVILVDSAAMSSASTGAS